jgi:rSAM/selenodomain-associated transferase 1
MAKYWTAGEVKTRLGAAIGMDAAARLHQRFTAHLCTNLAQTGQRCELCVAPDHRLAKFQQWLQDATLTDSWICTAQGSGDLGQRMSRWFERHLAPVSQSRPSPTSPPVTSAAILIGADCPTLTAADIEHAFGQLTRHDVVIGPAADGGYYLIGIRGGWNDRRAALFREIPWSGPEVLEVTCQRADNGGLSLARLPVAEDVDTIAELDRLRQRLAHSPSQRELRNDIERILVTASRTTDKETR